jgi:hypothetical protein
MNTSLANINTDLGGQIAALLLEKQQWMKEKAEWLKEKEEWLKERESRLITPTNAAPVHPQLTDSFPPLPQVSARPATTPPLPAKSWVDSAINVSLATPPGALHQASRRRKKVDVVLTDSDLTALFDSSHRRSQQREGHTPATFERIRISINPPTILKNVTRRSRHAIIEQMLEVLGIPFREYNSVYAFSCIGRSVIELYMASDAYDHVRAKLLAKNVYIIPDGELEYTNPSAVGTASAATVKKSTIDRLAFLLARTRLVNLHAAILKGHSPDIAAAARAKAFELESVGSENPPPTDSPVVLSSVGTAASDPLSVTPHSSAPSECPPDASALVTPPSETSIHRPIPLPASDAIDSMICDGAGGPAPASPSGNPSPPAHSSHSDHQ